MHKTPWLPRQHDNLVQAAAGQVQTPGRDRDSSAQLRLPRFGLHQDGDIGIGVFFIYGSGSSQVLLKGKRC
jgi:hypothetical protein